MLIKPGDKIWFVYLHDGESFFDSIIREDHLNFGKLKRFEKIKIIPN